MSESASQSAPGLVTKRIIVSHSSWTATIVSWISFLLLKPIRRYQIAYSKFPTPPKGPQQWTLPSPKSLNGFMPKGESCTASEWKHEASGWTMVSILPPPVGGAAKETTRAIMYFYGGAFQSAPIDFHYSYCAYLARNLDAEVFLVPYPLAPTNKAAEIMPVLTTVYEAFLIRAGSREAIVAGDSSGGLLSLCLAFAAHDAGLALPSQIVVVSPVLNLEMNHPDMLAIEKNDNILTREFVRSVTLAWIGIDVPAKRPKSLYSVPFPPDVLANPHYNPVAGDLSILAKAGTRLIVVSAAHEVLHAETVPFVERAEKAGVQVTYIEGERQFHDFSVFVSVTPECRRGAELVNEHVIANGKKATT